MNAPARADDWGQLGEAMKALPNDRWRAFVRALVADTKGYGAVTRASEHQAVIAFEAGAPAQPGRAHNRSHSRGKPQGDPRRTSRGGHRAFQPGPRP